MILKSKSRLVVAAALTLCVAGGALAQDRRNDDRPDRDGYREHQNSDDRRGPNEHQDSRDHRGFRERQDFREGRQFDRQGYPQPHAEWRRGDRVPVEYRGRNYVVDDWRQHRLQAPPRGYQWVGVGGDYVLIAVGTGLIAQIISGR